MSAVDDIQEELAFVNVIEGLRTLSQTNKDKLRQTGYDVYDAPDAKLRRFFRRLIGKKGITREQWVKIVDDIVDGKIEENPHG